jgi:hypothetical protein
MAETLLLEVKHLKKHFPIKGGVFSKTIGYVYAVDDINFTLEKGETLGLVGKVVVENRPLGARSCGSLNRRTVRSISRGRTSPPWIRVRCGLCVVRCKLFSRILMPR